MKKLFMLLGCALSAWMVNAQSWCGNSYITVNGTWYTADNEYVQPAGKFDGASLGTFEKDFTLGGELQAYPATDAVAIMHYQIDSETPQTISLPRTGTEGNNSKHYGEGTVSIADLDGGQHTLSVWFQAGDAWDSNSSQNYVATFTVAAMQFTLPGYVFLGEDINFTVLYEGAIDPVYTCSVKVPGADDFTTLEGEVRTYTPQAAGEYTFRVTVAESTAPETVLAQVEKTVMVRELPEPITVKVKVPAEWGTTISLWCWDEYDAGHWLYTTADGEWYTATLERLYPASFIVVNGSDWPSGDNSQQTVDVMGITASGCYEVGAVDEAQQGKRVVTSVDCGEEPGTGTGLDVMESHTTVLADGQGIQAAFDGTQRVQLYSVSGQLLHDATCDAAFAYPAAKGIYLLRIGGEAYKVAVK